MNNEISRYVDVSHDAEAPIDYPEIVDDFVAEGFVEIGRMILEPIATPRESLFADLSEEAGQAAMDHATTPTPILVAADHSAIVEVSWFWDTPSVRIRSMLSDGSLVETNRQWQHPPPLPERLAGFRVPAKTVVQQMQTAHVPSHGRSIAVSDTQSATEQWQHHLNHLDEYSTQRQASPVPISTMDECIALFERAFAHNLAVVIRATRAVHLALMAYFAIGVAWTYWVVVINDNPYGLLIVLLQLLGWLYAGGALDMMALHPPRWLRTPYA